MEPVLSPKGKSKKKHLLETSFRLFVQRGLNEVSLQDILDESNNKKGSFYHYFSSKDQLILEAFIECYQKPLYEWFDSVISRKMGAREAIEYYFYNTAPHMVKVWRSIIKDPSLRSQDVFLVTMEGIRKIGYFADHYEGYSDRLHKWILSLLKEEQQRGKISPSIDCQALASFIFSSCEGVYYIWIMDSNINFHHLMKNTFNFIWKLVDQGFDTASPVI